MMIATERATSGSSGSGAGRMAASVRILVNKLILLLSVRPSEARV
jgi:hypothetical protein